MDNWMDGATDQASDLIGRVRGIIAWLWGLIDWVFSPVLPSGFDAWYSFFIILLLGIFYGTEAGLMLVRTRKFTRLGVALITAASTLGGLFLYSAIVRLYPHTRSPTEIRIILTLCALTIGWAILEMYRTTELYAEITRLIHRQPRAPGSPPRNRLPSRRQFPSRDRLADAAERTADAAERTADAAENQAEATREWRQHVDRRESPEPGNEGERNA